MIPIVGDRIQAFWPNSGRMMQGGGQDVGLHIIYLGDALAEPKWVIRGML